MIRITEVNSFELLEPHREVWNSLLQRSRSNVVFLTYEFCQCWWKTMGAGHELIVLLAKDDQEIVGIAPLMINKRQRFGLRRRVVEFIRTLHSDYLDFIAAGDREAIIAAFWEHLWSIRDRWDYVRLWEIPEQSDTTTISGECLTASGRAYDDIHASTCPVIELGEQTDDVLKKIQKDSALRRRLNQLQRVGELEFRHAATLDQAMSYLDLFFQYHITRWETTCTPSTFYRASERDFYRELAKALLPEGWLALACFSSGEMCIGFHFAFEYNGAVASHRSAHCTYFNKYSPGRVLIYRHVEYCAAKGLREFDCLAGEEQYKGQLAKTLRHNRGFFLYKCAMQKGWEHLKGRLRACFPIAGFLRGGRLWPLRMRLRTWRARYGIWGIFKQAVRKAVSPFFQHVCNQLFVWSGEPLPSVDCGCKLDIRIGTGEDIKYIAALQGWTPESPGIADVTQRLSKGDRPYLAFCDRTLAHISWVCRRAEVEKEEIGAILHLEPDEAYVMDCKTFFTFRGKNIYPFVLQRILNDLRTEGVRRVYISCLPSNRASQQGILKAGFAKAGRVRVLKLLGRQVGSAKVRPRDYIKHG